MTGICAVLLYPCPLVLLLFIVCTLRCWHSFITWGWFQFARIFYNSVFHSTLLYHPPPIKKSFCVQYYSMIVQHYSFRGGLPPCLFFHPHLLKSLLMASY